jgi:hypothetical protein
MTPHLNCIPPSQYDHEVYKFGQPTLGVPAQFPGYRPSTAEHVMGSSARPTANSAGPRWVPAPNGLGTAFRCFVRLYERLRASPPLEAHLGAGPWGAGPYCRAG